MGFIYLIRDHATGLGYVGKTAGTVQRRWAGHCAARNTLIGRVIEASGAGNLTITTIDTVPDHDLAASEVFWILKLGTIWPKGYNVSAVQPRRTVQERAQIKAAQACVAPEPTERSRRAEIRFPADCYRSRLTCIKMCYPLQASACYMTEGPF